MVQCIQNYKIVIKMQTNLSKQSKKSYKAKQISDFTRIKNFMFLCLINVILSLYKKKVFLSIRSNKFVFQKNAYNLVACQRVNY